MGLTRGLTLPWSTRIDPFPEVFNRVKAVRPDALIAYYPLFDPNNTKARDYSGNGFDKTPSNVTAGAAGMGDGRTAFSFNGTTSYIPLGAAGFDGKWNGQSFSVVLWWKPLNAAVWTDATSRHMIRVHVNASNTFNMQRTTANGVLAIQYTAGGTLKQVVISGLSFLNFGCLGVTVSLAGNVMRGFLNGAKQGADLTGLGTWAGSLADANTIIGAGSTTPTFQCKGQLAHVAIWSTPLPVDAMAWLGRYDPRQGT